AWFMPNTFLWFLPLFVGMVLAIPLSVYSSRASWGDAARNFGLFLTPEETTPPPELVALQARLAISDQAQKAAEEPISNVTLSVVDPYLNAVHVSMLHEGKFNPRAAEEMARLGVGG